MLNEAGRAPEEMVLLEARQESLLNLVGELLAKNEQLRMKVARLESRGDTAQADSAGGY
jgi:hypothetical protein